MLRLDSFEVRKGELATLCRVNTTIELKIKNFLSMSSTMIVFPLYSRTTQDLPTSWPAPIYI